MTFKNEYPKKEITIETFNKKGSLKLDQNCKIHYRNYRGYLDSVNHIVIEGEKNAWYEIKDNFLYDTLIDNVKDVYTDTFGRIMKVNIIIK